MQKYETCGGHDIFQTDLAPLVHADVSVSGFNKHERGFIIGFQKICSENFYFFYWKLQIRCMHFRNYLFMGKIA